MADPTKTPDKTPDGQGIFARSSNYLNALVREKPVETALAGGIAYGGYKGVKHFWWDKRNIAKSATSAATQKGGEEAAAALGGSILSAFMPK